MSRLDAALADALEREQACKEQVEELKTYIDSQPYSDEMRRVEQQRDALLAAIVEHKQKIDSAYELMPGPWDRLLYAIAEQVAVDVKGVKA